MIPGGPTFGVTKRLQKWPRYFAHKDLQRGAETDASSIEVRDTAYRTQAATKRTVLHLESAILGLVQRNLCLFIGCVAAWTNYTDASTDETAILCCTPTADVVKMLMWLQTKFGLS